jgi:hypothetical protein
MKTTTIEGTTIGNESVYCKATIALPMHPQILEDITNTPAASLIFGYLVDSVYGRGKRFRNPRCINA